MAVRQGKLRQPGLPQSSFLQLLLAEGHAVGALILAGVALVGAHQDPVQRAVVLILSVVCTLLDGAFDALVGVAVHENCLLYFWILS